MSETVNSEQQGPQGGLVERLEGLLKRLPWLPLLVLALACGLVWGRTLSFEFVWDDRHFIAENEALRSPSRVVDLFTREDTQHGISQHMNWGVYRPLRTLHWAGLCWLTGRPNPVLYHAANLFWHTAACVLLYLFLNRLLSLLPEATARFRRSTALVLSLGFCVHPVTAEVVSWAKSMDDSLALALVLGALLAAWKAWEGPRTDWRWAGLSLLLHGAALLSKESVVALAPLFALPWAVARTRRDEGAEAPRAAKSGVPFWLWLAAQMGLTVAFVLVRHKVMGGSAQVTQPISGTYGQTLIDMLRVPLMYGRSMVGAPPFLPDYSFMEAGLSPFSLVSLAGGALFLGVVALTVFSAVRVLQARKDGTSAGWLPAATGLAWVLLALVPVSNLVPMMQYFAERFVYLPLAGAMIALCVPVARFAAARPRVFAAVAGVVILAWGGLAFRESGKWRNGRELMTYGYRNSPPSWRIVTNYLAVLDGLQDDRSIGEVIERHREMLKTRPEAEWMSAKSAFRQGRTEEARQRLTRLSSKLQNNADFIVDLGVAEAVTGHPAEAKSRFLDATQRWPWNPRGWENLGMALNGEGRFDQSQAALEKAVAMDPNLVNGWKALSLAAWKRQDWATARRALTQLARLEPQNREHQELLQSLASR